MEQKKTKMKKTQIWESENLQKLKMKLLGFLEFNKWTKIQDRIQRIQKKNQERYWEIYPKVELRNKENYLKRS